MKHPSGRSSRTAGLPPGTIVYSGERKELPMIIDIIEYDEKEIRTEKVKDLNDLRGMKENRKVSWVNVCGLGDTNKLTSIGEFFDIHPLVMEDIAHVDQRPKTDLYRDYLYITLRMLSLDKNEVAESEQMSIILGRSFVITFQEKPGDVFDPIRDRLKTSKGRIRRMGADYLAYSLMDAVVDNYFLVLEKVGDRIEVLEEEILGDPDRESMSSVHSVKRQLIGLRRSIWPLRGVISFLQRGEDSKLISGEISPYLRDLYDHTVQIVETIESYRDMATGLLDLYLSTVSNRMNEVMKVLTIIATIFIPLTFIAGIYGMNFRTDKSPLNMPELNWYWGYPYALLLMLIVTVIMVIYFKRKKWL
jgi:magnesium transporter